MEAATAKAWAVKVSVSVSDGGIDDLVEGDGEEEEVGGTGEVDPFAFLVLFALLKLAVDILHPIMASNAVGIVDDNVVVVVVGGTVAFSLISSAGSCLPSIAALSLEVVLVGVVAFSRKSGAPSLKA